MDTPTNETPPVALTDDEKLAAFQSSLVGLASIIGEQKGADMAWMVIFGIWTITGAFLGNWFLILFNLGMFAWSYHGWKKAKQNLADLMAGTYKGTDIFLKTKE